MATLFTDAITFAFAEHGTYWTQLELGLLNTRLLENKLKPGESHVSGWILTEVKGIEVLVNTQTLL